MIMTDASAETARLMNVMEAIVAELERQGGPTRYGFDPTPMARAVIRAADGVVLAFPGAAQSGIGR
jgi:hypothetical protein